MCCIRLVDADCDARAVLHDAASWLAFPCEYKAWLRGASSAPLLRKADQLQCEVLANAALISACREGRYVEVLERLERELPGSGESLSDTRHAATEHVLQAVRAATYDREPSSRHAALVSSL